MKSVQKFTCKICNKNYKSKQSLCNHNRRFHKNTLEISSKSNPNIIQISSKSNPNIIHINSNSEGYKCRFCNNRYKFIKRRQVRLLSKINFTVVKTF